MPRHQSHGDGGGGSARSLPRRSSGDVRLRRPHHYHYHHQHHRRPPLSKSEIISEAGRLAAEYLVSKGLLPPDSLEKPLPRRPMPPPDDRRSSKRVYDNAFAPPDRGRSRRRYNGDDEFDRLRKHSGSKREMEYGDRRHNGAGWREWGRPRGRDRRWESRSRGDDDFAPGFRRGWRGGLREVESSSSRAAGADEVQSRSDVTGDSRSETNYELTGDSRGLKLEAGEEVRSRAAGDLEKDRALLSRRVEDGLVGSERDMEVLNLSCYLAKVPTKLRSSLAQKSSKTDQNSDLAGGEAIEAFSARESKNLGNVSCDSHENKSDAVNHQTFDDFNVHCTQPVEESLNSQHESHRSPRGIEMSGLVVDEGMEGSSQLHAEKRKELKNEGESTPSRVSQGNEHIQMLNSEAPQSDEGSKVDVYREPDSVVKMDAENRQKPLLFKTLDLNLEGSPEITEITHAPVFEEKASSLAAGNNSVDFGLSICSAGNANDGRQRSRDKEMIPVIDLEDTDNANDGRQRSRDKEMIPVIDLEDDSLASILSSSSKPKSEVIPSSPEDVMTHTPETNDAPTVQDGYSLEITQLLGGNISRCPSVQADLSNLQDEMSLYNAEGFSGEDDPIYVSLGEFPMGLIDVWGQPPQDYGKLF